MAIDAPPYQDAGDFVLPQKRFWPVRVPVSHWQLRHYLSNPEPNLLYYASGREVYCLDTVTRKRRLIAILPFDARCTASGHGWVCIGGEKEGHFAAIKLDGSGPRSQDVDAALPISALSGSRQTPSVKIERIGEEIVNSISIHRITDEAAHLDDIVAVLTNNDHTVRVYSLPRNKVTAIISLPHAMNHATISHDGTMMVAVGDYNQAFFYARLIKDRPPQIPKPHNRLNSTSIDWVHIKTCDLHATDPDQTIGYFTTAWSPDEKLVAVGSEGGYITVFDVKILLEPDAEGDDAVVAMIPSSRPDLPIPYVGAVRSMMFSPAPWDLLIWAEDQGRVCVGDVRSGLRRKQILELDPKEEGLQKVEIEDALTEGATHEEIESLLQASQRHLEDLESDFLRRYGSQDNATAVNFATEYVDARRRQRQQRTQTSENATRPTSEDSQGLTTREHQVLDALRTSRQREEQRAGGRPPSINYTSADSAGRWNSGTADANGVPTRGMSDIWNTVNELFPELARSSAWSRRQESSLYTLPPLSVPGDALSWSNTRFNALTSGTTDNSRMFDIRLPRRRTNVVPTPPDSTADRSTTSSIAPETIAATNGSGRLTPTTSSDEPDEEHNPWRTIENAMASAGSPLLESTGRVPAQPPAPAPSRNLENRLAAHVIADRADRADRIQSIARQRDRLRLSRREIVVRSGDRPGLDANLEAYEAASRHFANFANNYGGPSIGARTAGLAMSKDGKILWVACEDGIFEFQINRKGRMFWPSIEPR